MKYVLMELMNQLTKYSKRDFLVSYCHAIFSCVHSWPEMMSLLGRAKTQLLGNGALTAEQWVRLKARRAEEKQAAIDRAREQEERRLAILNGGDKIRPFLSKFSEHLILNPYTPQ